MPRGRKSKYTPEVVKRILDGIRVGATLTHACAAGGISFETFNEWRKDKPEFSEAIKKAEGECVVMRLARINKAGQEGTWQADAWTLERRYPHDYGRTVQDVNANVEVSGGITLYLPKKGKNDDSNG